MSKGVEVTINGKEHPNKNGVLDSVMKRLEYYEKVKEQLIKNNTNKEDLRSKWFEGQIYMIELVVFDLKQIIENAS